MPGLLLYSGKVGHVVFKPVNPSRAVPINQTISSNKGKGASIDLNLAATPEGHNLQISFSNSEYKTNLLSNNSNKLAK